MMRTRTTLFVTLPVLGAALIGCTKPDQNAATADSAAASAMDTAAPVSAPAKLGSAEYTIVVKSRWTKAEHPFEWAVGGAFLGSDRRKS